MRGGTLGASSPVQDGRRRRLPCAVPHQALFLHYFIDGGMKM